MRVLFAIGCNDYEHAPALSSAEKDAQDIFDALLRPEVGQYDPKVSRLLLSPTLEQVRKYLMESLFVKPNIETYTFFFAGHGGVSSGSFYMWVRDSNPAYQSMSALSLSDLFRSLNEAKPEQSNIIIDACESGGLIRDLSTLLKPELLGDSGAPTITLVATAGQNQKALEVDTGGLGTNAILDCIKGRDFVQDNTSTLDLVEIGRRVSIRLNESGQNPIVWGLNLYGPPRFCRNPRYASDPTAPLRDLIYNWPSEASQSIRQNHDALWGAYNSINKTWDPERFCQTISAVLISCAENPVILSNHINRLATTFLLKAMESQDPYRGSQVAACLATCLLPFLGDSPVASSAQRILDQCCDELLKANELLISDLSNNKYALLSRSGGGLSDLYHLPIRVTKVLGWAAAATVIHQTPEQTLKAEKHFSEITSMLLEFYESSIVALSDAQAPYWAIALSRAKALGMQEEAERLAGLIFNSLTNFSGKLSRWDLPPEKALDFLLARRTGNFSAHPELVEKPIETLTVLLKAAIMLGLDDVFDEDLWRLDGTPLAAYIPADYHQFGEEMMQGGQYLFWSVGHDIFRTRDLAATWPYPTLLPGSTLVTQIATVASLLLLDRVPWFHLEPEIVPSRESTGADSLNRQ